MASETFELVAGMIRDSTVARDDENLSAQEIRAGMESMTGAMPLIEGSTVAEVDAGGVPADWVRPANASADDACILYLHGGGYVIGSRNTHRPFASHLAARTGLPVLLVDYRLAPEHAFPAAVDDALAAYEWLLAEGFAPGRIVIAGDSAGGGLTLATLVALRDLDRPLPAAGVPISPWTDLSLSGASMDELDGRDPMCTRAGLQRMADWYLAGTDARDPLASPLFAELGGLPPLLVHVGEVEVLRDDSVRFAERAAAAGVAVTVEVWPEMIHVWHVFGPAVPESEAGVMGIAEFVAKQLALPVPTAG